ncbi:MAG: hypothetical protein MZV70_62940 [Desulfobacterales bacterium]|nr:hypothetical protein [Desulfobacterales bacterium]
MSPGLFIYIPRTALDSFRRANAYPPPFELPMNTNYLSINTFLVEVMG